MELAKSITTIAEILAVDTSEEDDDTSIMQERHVRKCSSKVRKSRSYTELLDGINSDKVTDKGYMILDQPSNKACSWQNNKQKGIQLYQMKKFDKAMKFFIRGFPKSNKCETMTSNMEFNYLKAESFAKIGSCLRELKQYEVAESYFNQILDVKDDLFASLTKFYANCQLEKCSERMSKNFKKYTQKKREMMASREWSLIPKMNLAEIYYFSGDYLNALEIYQDIFDDALKSNNKMGKIISFCNIGHVYFAAGYIDEAFEAYKSVKKISLKTKRSVLASVLYNLYQINRNRKDLTSAKAELYAYIILSSQLGDNFNKCLGYESMSDLLTEMNDIKGAYEFAEKYLECAQKEGDNDEILCASNIVDRLCILEPDISEIGPF